MAMESWSMCQQVAAMDNHRVAMSLSTTMHVEHHNDCCIHFESVSSMMIELMHEYCHIVEVEVADDDDRRYICHHQLFPRHPIHNHHQFVTINRCLINDHSTAYHE